jgi:outer membrane lipoprotein-sorting protein
VRPAVAVALGVVVGLLAFAGLRSVAGWQAARETERLLGGPDAGLSPMSGDAVLRVLTGGTWREAHAQVGFAGERSRTTIGSGASRIVIVDDGRSTWRLDAATQTAVGAGPSERAADWSAVLRNYEPVRVAGRTVVGRPAEGLMLVSRRTGKPALAAWVDRGTGIVVERLTYDIDGHLVSSTELTSLRPQPDLDPADLAAPQGWRRLPADGASAASQVRDEAGFEPRWPRYVPRGYARMGLYMRFCPQGCPYAELRYADGLRTMSIYEHVPGRGRGRGGRGRGWGCACGGAGRPPDARPVVIDVGQAKTVRERRADLMFVVSGDLTEQEIVGVLRSIP